MAEACLGFAYASFKYFFFKDWTLIQISMEFIFGDQRTLINYLYSWRRGAKGEKPLRKPETTRFYYVTWNDYAIMSYERFSHLYGFQRNRCILINPICIILFNIFQCWLEAIQCLNVYTTSLCLWLWKMKWVKLHSKQDRDPCFLPILYVVLPVPVMNLTFIIISFHILSSNVI